MALLLALIAAISWGLAYFIEKLAINQGTHPLYIQIVIGIANFIYIPVYWYLLSSWGHAKEYSFNGIVLAFIAATIIIAGSTLYVFALNLGEAGSVSVVSSTYPILTLTLSCLFLGEPITLKKIISVLLILTGIYLLK